MRNGVYAASIRAFDGPTLVWGAGRVVTVTGAKLKLSLDERCSSRSCPDQGFKSLASAGLRALEWLGCRCTAVLYDPS